MTVELAALDGTTRVVGMLGDPVKQVRAPGLAAEIFAARGENIVVVPMHVTPGDLDALVGIMKKISNVIGFIYTVPHKIPALAHADRLSDIGGVCGSINTLRREKDGSWLGVMFDGEGCLVGLDKDGAKIEGANILLVGGGGVGSAIGAGLALRGAGRIDIFDVDGARAEALAGRLGKLGETEARAVSAPDPAGMDIVINATPVGMKADDPLPVDPERLTSGMFVAEVIMKPHVTPLLERAREMGCRTALGENLIKYQIEPVCDFFSAAAELGDVTGEQR